MKLNKRILQETLLNLKEQFKANSMDTHIDHLQWLFMEIYAHELDLKEQK